MRILVVTNLYPPQELGGYGRCIADFVWGLIQNGNSVGVLCSNADYLDSEESSVSHKGSNGEIVIRELKLKGSYKDGVTEYTDSTICAAIDDFNISLIGGIDMSQWDGILVGNLDLLGSRFLQALTSSKLPVLHHISFTSLPFSVHEFPGSSNYSILAASQCVRENIRKSGVLVDEFNVVYPGARCELFSSDNSSLSYALQYALSLAERGYSLGSVENPLKIGFAGLLMGSKGLHTLVLAALQLAVTGISIQINIAGAEFQSNYKSRLQAIVDDAGMHGLINFVGQLDRKRLSRFWELHHLGVFPSIHPEAFGIVGAEIMASGVALITSGVGGSSELIDHNSGFTFKADSPEDLSKVIKSVRNKPDLIARVARNGKERAHTMFSVVRSSEKIQKIFLKAKTS